MIDDIITATVETDRIVVRIYDSCTFEYSDDGRQWRNVEPIHLRSDSESVIYYDRTAPLNRPRYYLARTGDGIAARKQLVAATQKAPQWWLKGRRA